MNSTSQRKILAYLLLMLTALFWSGNVLVARAMSGSLTPLQLVFGRWILAALVLLPFALPRAWAVRHQLWAQRIRVLALAVVGIVGFNTFLYFGLQWTSATHAALLNSFIPILTIGASAIFWKARLTLLQGLGLIISLSGVFIILSHGQLNQLLSFSFNRGDLIIIGALISWSLYTLWIQALNKDIDGLGLLFVLIILGIILLFPAVIFEAFYLTHSFEWTLTISLSLLYVGIFPSVLAYLFYHYGIQQLGAAKASLCIHLMPVFTPMLAFFLLSEALYFYHFIGILFIFIGLYLSMARKK